MRNTLEDESNKLLMVQSIVCVQLLQSMLRTRVLVTSGF